MVRILCLVIVIIATTVHAEPVELIISPQTTVVDGPKNPDGTINYVAALNAKLSEGARQSGAAKKAGFGKTRRLHSVLIEGADKPGLGAELAEQLSAAGINLRGISAASIGKKFVAYLALDTAGDASKAVRCLRKL